MAYSALDAYCDICATLGNAGLPEPPADADETESNEHTAKTVTRAIDDRAALRTMLEQLIEYDAASGRSDARVWSRARALYRATGIKGT